jgi:hypothetical protein
MTHAPQSGGILHDSRDDSATRQFLLVLGQDRGKVADIKGWALANLLDDTQIELLLREAKGTLPKSILLKAAFLSILL